MRPSRDGSDGRCGRGRRPLGALALCCAIAGCDIRDEAVEPAATAPLLRTDAALAGMLGRAAERITPQRRALEYVDGFEAGRKRAAAEAKPLLVICRAAWCRWSAEMTQDTLAEPRIIGLASRFVCVMVDADRHADTCRDLDVTAFPTVILLAPTGEERYRGVGRPSTPELVAALEATLRPAVASGRATPAR